MVNVIPPALHRAILRLAHRIRSRWRRWRKAHIYGCTVVIEDAGGRVLLQRHSYGSERWALPGGGLKPGDDPAQGARREMAEELDLELDQLELMDTIKEVISGSPHTAYVFRGLAASTPVPDQREVLEARFFAADEWPEGLSVITLQRLAIWREYVGR